LSPAIGQPTLGAADMMNSVEGKCDAFIDLTPPFLINRELKMIELKERIKDLEKATTEAGPMKRAHKRIMQCLVALFTVLALAFAWGADVRAAGSERYAFGVTPQFEQRKLHAIWAPIIRELEQRTGLSFELVTTLNIKDFEKEVAAGNFDFVYTNPYHILMESKNQRYIPLVRDKAPLRGILVVRKDSAVQKPSELAGKVVAFPSPNAIAASLLMRADLERIHHTTVTPLYVKTHSSVYLHVAKGLADAGGGVEKTLQEQEPAIRDLLRIIYTTRPMMSHPVAAHPRVPKRDREKVRAALLKLAETGAGKELLAKVPVKQLVPASIHDYESMLTWGLEAYWDAAWKEE
jgi:phosphonate transport system substrate-binding protein